MHCGFDKKTASFIQSYVMKISRNGTVIERFYVKGTGFTSEIYQFLKEDALSNDRVDFTEIVAFKNKKQLLFNEFWFIVE